MAFPKKNTQIGMKIRKGKFATNNKENCKAAKLS